MDVNVYVKFIEQVCAAHIGNLQDHQSIQTALQVIKSKLESEPEDKQLDEEKAE